MIKKALVWIVVAFAAYSVIATPDTAANAVRTAGNGGQTGVRAVIEFFDALSPGSHGSSTSTSSQR